MKKFFGFNKLLASVAVLASVMIFQSCLDDDDNDYYRYALPNALVTVKPVADNSFFMQLDDSTTLLPVNMKNSPYGEKEVRALVNFDPGRSLLRASLVDYFTTLQGMEAIQNFDVSDVVIVKGNDSDAVVVTANIQPVDSVEKIYITVNLS